MKPGIAIVVSLCPFLLAANPPCPEPDAVGQLAASIQIIGDHALPAESAWNYLTETDRTVAGTQISLSDHAEFIPTADPARAEIRIKNPSSRQGEAAAAWLNALADSGTGDRTVLDRTDLDSILLLEEVVGHPDIAPLFGTLEAKQDLLVRLKAEKDAVDDEEDRLDEEAKRIVEAWTDEDWRESLWHPHETKSAVASVDRELFNRHQRRQREGLKIRKKILERIIELERAAADLDGEALRENQLERSGLSRAYIELVASAGLNDELGLIKQGGPRLWKFVDRFLDWAFGPQTYDRQPAHAIDVSTLDPVRSTFWSRRSDDDITPLRLYEGPWFPRGELPTLPDPQQNLVLDAFRNAVADGFHPSVKVVDEDGDEWKHKLFNTHYQSAEAITSRLFWALGYETEPTYYQPVSQIEPRALAAAYKYKNRALGIFNPFSYESTVLAIRMKDGSVLMGEAALKAFDDALDDHTLLDAMDHVKVRFSELIYKDGPAEAIGPWDYDALGHDDRREVRAVGMVISWLLGDDYKFNNVRLDAVEEADDEFRIIHRMSDVGESVLFHETPDHVPFEVDLDPLGPIYHNNKNGYVVKAFDKMDYDDARWAVRQIGRLSEDQITASFVAGSHSWPLTRSYIEGFVARRDDLVKKFELEAELGLLRPNGPDTELTVIGAKFLTFTDGDRSEGVFVPGGGYRVIEGRVVELPQFSFVAPEGWTAIEIDWRPIVVKEEWKRNTVRQVGYVSEDGATNLVVNIQEQPSMTLAEYARATDVQMREWGATRLARESFRHGDRAGLKMVYENARGQTQVFYSIIANGYSYDVIGTAASEDFAKHEAAFATAAATLVPLSSRLDDEPVTPGFTTRD